MITIKWTKRIKRLQDLGLPPQLNNWKKKKLDSPGPKWVNAFKMSQFKKISNCRTRGRGNWLLKPGHILPRDRKPRTGPIICQMRFNLLTGVIISVSTAALSLTNVWRNKIQCAVTKFVFHYLMLFTICFPFTSSRKVHPDFVVAPNQNIVP